MVKSEIIVVAGPTASGKSALATGLARREGGTIINADAMQIYAGLPILTAQPTAAERKEVPHELYAAFDPSETSSAGRWLRTAALAIEKAIADGRRPILVGGTGLYFRALLGGLADIPDVPELIRTRSEKLYDDIGEESFRAELAKLDPESAKRIARNDRQRLIRACAVALHTGKPLSDWHKDAQKQGRFRIAQSHLLLPPRDELYAACDRRFLKMVEMGAVEEVREFLARNLPATLPAMKTLGLREIGAHLRGEITLDQAIAKAQQATRNYAKRQMTWFRNQWERG